MCVLKLQILRPEPLDKSRDAIRLGGVAALFDVAGHVTSKGVAACVADQMSAEGADLEQGGSGGHCLDGSAGPPLRERMVSRLRPTVAATVTNVHSHHRTAPQSGHPPPDPASPDHTIRQTNAGI